MSGLGRLMAVLFLSGLTGCATGMIPKSVREQTTPGLSFADVNRNPDAHKGQKVLWGGQVLSLTNAKEGTTLHVLQIPTDSEGEPVNPEASQGRFIVFVRRYLDAAIFEPGRRVTVFGTIDGSRTEPLGEGQMDYSFPVVNGETVYLWPRRLASRPVYYDPWWPYWDGGPWPGFYGGPRVGIGFRLH